MNNFKQYEHLQITRLFWISRFEHNEVVCGTDCSLNRFIPQHVYQFLYFQLFPFFLGVTAVVQESAEFNQYVSRPLTMSRSFMNILGRRAGLGNHSSVLNLGRQQHGKCRHRHERETGADMRG